MRTFYAQRASDTENQILIKQLRITRPLAPYARRSDPTAKDAKKDKTQSREMQTEDFIKWGLKNGWPESLIFPFFADLGLSGTLPPDQRPDMFRLFDYLDRGLLDDGTIACWQENRPFRDETHIYYNQLIEKMKKHNVVLVVLSPRLYLYDMRDPFDEERLRDKFKEAANYIPTHIKGWLHPARERAAWEDDEWAGLGDLPPGFIVDYDPYSPTFKHAIPFEPHMEKVREYFALHMELGGEISLLYQHLRQFPIVFPAFDPSVDRRNVDRFKLTPYPGGGYYIKSKGSVVKLLTCPLYYGYHSVKGVIRRDASGKKIRSFPPVVDPDMWEFAFYRHAKTDLDGNPLDQEGRRRFFQKKNDGNFGLLKFRVSSSQGEVLTHCDESKRGGGNYSIQTYEEGYLYHRISLAEIACDEIDSLVVSRLLEHVEELTQQQESREEYEKHAAEKRREREQRKKQFEKSITDIAKRQGALTRSLGEVEAAIEDAEATQDKVTKELKERRKELIETEIDTLELERRRLLKAQEQLAKEEEDNIGSLEEELIRLKEGWHGYKFSKRRALLNFAVQRVTIEVMSTHWVRIQVAWLHEEWPQEEMFYRRKYGTVRGWSDEDNDILKAHYATMPKAQLMALLPNRGWNAILNQAQTLNLFRPMGRPKGETVGGDRRSSYADIQFMKQADIPEYAACTQWKALSVQ